MKTTLLAKNKKAYSEYEILETFEAGIILNGGEVKSVRNRQVNLKGSFVDVNDKGEIAANEIHISTYKFAHDKKIDPARPRKLLLHANEILKIEKQLNTKGVTCIPLEIYLKGGLIKLKIGIVRGLKKHDKRARLKDKSQKREIDKAVKNFSRN
jgi:SsrA-binding protein